MAFAIMPCCEEKTFSSGFDKKKISTFLFDFDESTKAATLSNYFDFIRVDIRLKIDTPPTSATQWKNAISAACLCKFLGERKLASKTA